MYYAPFINNTSNNLKIKYICFFNPSITYKKINSSYKTSILLDSVVSKFNVNSFTKSKSFKVCL